MRRGKEKIWETQHGVPIPNTYVKMGMEASRGGSRITWVSWLARLVNFGPVRDRVSKWKITKENIQHQPQLSFGLLMYTRTHVHTHRCVNKQKT